jgi:hypothetical protein
MPTKQTAFIPLISAYCNKSAYGPVSPCSKVGPFKSSPHEVCKY